MLPHGKRFADSAKCYVGIVVCVAAKIAFESDMAKTSDPTKDPEFKRVLGNLLKAPPKPHADMKIGKRTAKTKTDPKRKK